MMYTHSQHKSMQSYLIVWASFIGSFLLHVIVHRVSLRRRTVTLWSTTVYGVGALAVYWFWLKGYVTLPVSSGFLYVLLSAAAIFFYLTPYLGGETPVSMILTSFQQKKRQTIKNLVSLFSVGGLIEKRIEDLVVNNLVVRRGGKLRITPTGYAVYLVIQVYKSVFHRSVTV